MLVFIKLTNGFGNNLFQYIAGRLLAEFYNKEIVLCPPSTNYYGIKQLTNLNLEYHDLSTSYNSKKVIIANNKNYTECFSNKYRNYDIVVDGYFENYQYYLNHFHKIKSWFQPINKRKDNNLVLHLRTGDRLFYKSEYSSTGKPLISIESVERAIKKINFNQLFIVSDLPKFEIIGMKTLKSYQFHIRPNPSEPIIYQWALDYHNDIIKMLSQFSPVFQNKEIYKDFNTIRSFKNIIFQHSTTAWWASVLSDAETVGVYGPWRPFKGKTNKNLSNVPLSGWYKWD
ncbi:MAG: hypothetical protein VX770_05765 [Candidatus Neomarinimicrobiota bacterium]|nr:hypothetical protein [Candidatus Neomarinimicrobiota bacterium]